MSTYELDHTAEQVIAEALELYMRLRMGQWDRLADVCVDLVEPYNWDLKEKLLKLRCDYALQPQLRHPSASMGISICDDSVKAAYDMWQVFATYQKPRDLRLSNIGFNKID